MTVIRLITNNYLQILRSLGSSCGESRLNIALQNPPSLSLSLFLPSSISLYHAPSFIPLCIRYPPLPPTTIHLLSTLLRFNHFPSPHFRSWPPLICPLLSSTCILVGPRLSLSPCNTISLLNSPHPVYLFAWLSQHRRSPFTRFLFHERLSIHLASRLIYHPSGGCGGGECKLAEETEGRRLRHLFKFSLPTGLFT